MQAPQNIVYHKIAQTLELIWTEVTYQLPAELLRVYSPSAEVRGHSAEQRTLQVGKKHVGIRAIEPIGNYAIRLTFDDGHDTGIYPWDLLYDLGARQDDHWHEYLTELKANNASRLPQIAGTAPVGQWQPPK